MPHAIPSDPVGVAADYPLSFQAGAVPGLDEIETRTRLLNLGVGPDAFTEHPHCTGQAALFFPQDGKTVMTPYEERGALRICANCPVRDWCLQNDLTTAASVADVIGVRGGIAQAARRRIYTAMFARRAA